MRYNDPLDKPQIVWAYIVYTYIYRHLNNNIIITATYIFNQYTVYSMQLINWKVNRPNLGFDA